MLKKTIIALAAIGFVGSVTLTPITPAEAFFICAANSKHADSDRCKKQAERRAERKAKWAEFWNRLGFRPHKKRS